MTGSSFSEFLSLVYMCWINNWLLCNCLRIVSFECINSKLLGNVLDERFSLLKYSSFSRGCHVYKDGWQPTMGDDSLHCKEEKDSE